MKCKIYLFYGFLYTLYRYLGNSTFRKNKSVKSLYVDCFECIKYEKKIKESQQKTFEM